VRASRSPTGPWWGQKSQFLLSTRCINSAPQGGSPRGQYSSVGSPSSGTAGVRRSGLSQLRDKRVRTSRLVSSPSRAPGDRPAMHATPFLHIITLVPDPNHVEPRVVFDPQLQCGRAKP